MEYPNWLLHSAPWRNLLLIQEKDDPDESWKMRPWDRVPAQDVALRFCEWFVGVVSPDLNDLKARWRALLVPAQSDDSANKMWKEIEKQKKACSG